MPLMKAGETREISFRLNGRAVTVRAAPRELMHDVLRHHLGATGTHVGCEHGVCGACTVQVNGAPARSCLMLVGQAEGLDIRTVEDLAENGNLSPLQAAFRDNFALQCGFCTAGILMSLDALFTRDPDAGEETIRNTLSGHLCRCTGYAPIVRAAIDARDAIKGGRAHA